MAVTDKEFKKLAGRIVDMEKKFKTMDSQIYQNKVVCRVLTKENSTFYQRFNYSMKDIYKRLQILEKRK